MATTHPCPGSCGAAVEQHLFACRTCWRRLPKDLQNAIWAGYRERRLGGRHLAAMADARDWFADHPADRLVGDR